MRIEILKDVTLETGRKLYREDTINTGTRALFDFRSAWGGAAKDIGAVGSIVKDLAYTENTLTLQNGGSVLTYQNNGLRFPTATQSQMARFVVSNNAVPKFADTNWLAQFWIAPEKYSNASSTNNQLFMFGIDNGFTVATTMLGCNVNVGSDQLTPTYFNFAVRGVLMQVTNNAIFNALMTASSAAKPVLLSIHCQVIDANTVISLYANGSLIQTRTVASQATSFTATRNYINSAGVYTNHIAGKYYRYRLDDITAQDKTAVELITQEYEQCKDIFS